MQRHCCLGLVGPITFCAIKCSLVYTNQSLFSFFLTSITSLFVILPQQINMMSVVSLVTYFKTVKMHVLFAFSFVPVVWPRHGVLSFPLVLIARSEKPQQHFSFRFSPEEHIAYSGSVRSLSFCFSCSFHSFSHSLWRRSSN